jgi:two-component system, CitB family, response regulator MalR
VLIVEDDPMVAEINKRYLESISGFVCIGVAANAMEAKAVLDKKMADLVLLDIFMPGESGLALLKEIRKEEKSIDVIVISAANDMHSIKTALRLGAVDYLIKPFEFERLNAALRMYQQEHELMRKQEELSQEDLDNWLLYQSRSKETRPELPKGLAQETLQRVVNLIFELGNEGFSTEELADKVGISRVSVRKYLKFLADIGFVTVTLTYRSVGRPVAHYRLCEMNKEKIAPYLKAPHR